MAAPVVHAQIPHLLLPWFVLQVDRLEQELAELRRSQEEQATAAATRARTTGVLEEYKARTQQALKRANEITSQTASENKRLEASDYYARELPQARSLRLYCLLACASTVVTGWPDFDALVSICFVWL